MYLRKSGGGSGSGGVGGSDLSFVYTQAIPAASWTISHGLGKYPSVSVADSSGSWVIGDVTYLGPNSVRLDFGGAFAGVAYLN